MRVWDAFYVFPGIGWVWSIQVEILFVSSLSWRGFVNTWWDVFCGFMLGPWSTHIKLHFVSSLAWDGICQHKLRYIFCPRWHKCGLVNTSWAIFWVACEWFCKHMLRLIFFPRWNRRVTSIQVEILFECSLAWDRFGQHMLMWSFVSSLALDGFDQHRLICILCPG